LLLKAGGGGCYCQAGGGGCYYQAGGEGCYLRQEEGVVTVRQEERIVTVRQEEGANDGARVRHSGTPWFCSRHTCAGAHLREEGVEARSDVLRRWNCSHTQ
jgi:hypothetical protein